MNHSPRGCRRVKLPAHEVATHDATHDPCTTCRGLICCPIPSLPVPQNPCRSSWWSASRETLAEELGSASCPGPPLTAWTANHRRGLLTRRRCYTGRRPGASPSRNNGTGCRRTRRGPPSRSSARRARCLRHVSPACDLCAKTLLVARHPSHTLAYVCLADVGCSYDVVHIPRFRATAQVLAPSPCSLRGALLPVCDHRLDVLHHQVVTHREERFVKTARRGCTLPREVLAGAQDRGMGDGVRTAWSIYGSYPKRLWQKVYGDLLLGRSGCQHTLLHPIHGRATTKHRSAPLHCGHRHGL